MNPYSIAIALFILSVSSLWLIKRYVFPGRDKDTLSAFGATASSFIALVTMGTAFWGVSVAIETLKSQEQIAERAVRPVLVFFNTGQRGNGMKDRWAVRNEGKEPALNVIVSYQKLDSSPWVKDNTWPIGISSIGNEKCFIFLSLQGPNSILAEYEDVRGQIWTTKVIGNKNYISPSPSNIRYLPSASKDQWQLIQTQQPSFEGLGMDCLGIE